VCSLERSIAIAQQDANAAGSVADRCHFSRTAVPIRHSRIKIVIEVAGYHRIRRLTGRIGNLRPKRPITFFQKDGDGLVAAVHGHEVCQAVAVEIAGCDRNLISSHREIRPAKYVRLGRSCGCKKESSRKHEQKTAESIPHGRVLRTG